jgi:hypothetical protein
MQLGPLKKEYGAKLSTVFEPASELVGALWIMPEKLNLLMVVIGLLKARSDEWSMCTNSDFYFGRLDIMYQSLADLEQGKILLL